MTYQFSETVDFAQGDTMNYACTWNNSESNDALDGDPQTTGYGERTNEEMCFFFTLVSF